jgi:hypothetical protein
MTPEDHRLAQRVAKARRNAGRRRRRRNPILLRWRPQREHRCVGCGRWIALGAEAGHGWGLPVCEPCWVASELRQASVWALPAARTVVVSGAA